MTKDLTQNFSAVDPRDKKRFYFHETRTRRFIVLLVRGLVATTMNASYAGQYNVPSKGPFVLVSNHLTNFDVFVMQTAILHHPIFFMAKAELFNPFLDEILRRLGAFPIYRGERDQWALRHAEQILAHNQVLGMFPEGTRSKGRGLRSGKTGAAHLAIKANCPMIPMAIAGTDQLFKEFPRRTPVRVEFGTPMMPEPGESPGDLTERAMIEIAKMLPVELQGNYAKKI